jgi:hypothetical protein
MLNLEIVFFLLQESAGGLTARGVHGAGARSPAGPQDTNVQVVAWSSRARQRRSTKLSNGVAAMARARARWRIREVIAATVLLISLPARCNGGLVINRLAPKGHTRASGFFGSSCLRMRGGGEAEGPRIGEATVSHVGYGLHEDSLMSYHVYFFVQPNVRSSLTTLPPCAGRILRWRQPGPHNTQKDSAIRAKLGQRCTCWHHPSIIPRFNLLLL